VAVVFDHVSIGVTRTIFRRHEGRPDQRQPDLPAVGVAGERERDPWRNAGKDVRLMHQQHNGIVGADAGERPGKVVDTAEAAVAERMRELIANARQPEFLPRRAQQHRIVLEHGNAYVRERTAHPTQVIPPIVITEDRPGAKRCAKTREFCRPEQVLHANARELIAGDEIPEQDDKIGAQLVGGIHHVAHMRKQHVRSAGMKVRDHRNG
jgi:hypothetical protein